MIIRKRRLFFLLTLTILFSITLNLNLIISNTGKSSCQLGNDECLQVSSDGSSIVPEWVEIWGTTNRDEGRCIEIDSSGNIYVAGFTNSSPVKKEDFLLIKYDSSGEEIWSFTWGGNGYDVCNGIAIDSADNIYLAGSTDRAGDMDEVLVKVSSSGSLEWYYIHDRTGYDYCTSIAINSQGMVWLGGYFFGSSGTFDISLIRYNPVTNSTSIRGYGFGGMNEYCTGIAIDSSNKIWVAGYKVIDPFHEIILLRFSSNGVHEQSNEWYYEDGIATCIKIDSLNNKFIGGYFYNGASKDNDSLLIKTDSSGVFQWHRKWGGSGIEESHGIELDSNENIYLVGSTTSFGQGQEDLSLLKYSNNNGILLLNATWGDIADDGGLAVTCDSFDNVYLAGFTYSHGAGLSDLFLLKSLPFYEIDVKYPREGQFFSIPPTFQIEIHPQFTNRWYTLNDGIQCTFSGESDIINQTEWDSCEDGQVIIEFYANDSTGNMICGKVSVLKDTILPQIVINSPKTNQLFGNSTIDFDLDITEDNLNATWYTLNNGAINEFLGTSGTINQAAWDLCENGTVSIKFYANDSAGNIDWAQIDVRKDCCGPNISIIYPTQYQIFGDSAFDFELSIVDGNLNTTWYTLDNGITNYFFTGTNGTIKQTAWDNYNDGAVFLRFHGNDSLGNTAFREVKIFKSYFLTLKIAHAIIIGISDYPGADDDLPYCRRDVDSIYNFLRISCNYKQENIIRLTDSAATLSGIANAFNQIKSIISPYDEFFFYFSGHGGELSGNHFICPHNSIPFNPAFLFYDADLDFRLDQLNCERMYVLIDACYSGGMIPESQASGRYIMTACEAWELSFMTSELRNSVFTYFFVDSFFNSGTDTNGDGLTSLEEMYSYTYSETVAYMLARGESQHPDKYDGIPGRTILYPSLGSLSLIPIGNELHYSFHLYGHGILECLNITVCSVFPSISLKIVDLRYSSPTNTGFGYYSGMIQLEQGLNVSGYEIRAEIGGYRLVTIVNTFGDTDNDGLHDIFEIINGLDPTLNDTDNDGLNDYDEFYGPTDPTLSDTDGDGMPDGFEVANGLNPTQDDALLDLDGDELSNIVEYLLGSQVNNPDTDGDTMDDGYEYHNGLDLLFNDANLDLDGDGLINVLEFQIGSAANNSDSDSDSMPDKWEYDNDLNLTLNDAEFDPDNDGLSNIEEYQHGTDPQNADTDGDGWTDGDEIAQGTDPLDPNDFPRSDDGDDTPTKGSPAIPGFNIILILGILEIMVGILLKRKNGDPM